jgi:prolipoprotein diacylglyceryltransferase
MVSYGIVRFGLEYMRHPDGFVPVDFITLTLGQALSLPMMAAGLYWLSGSARSLSPKNG